jgi:hypothetical protein
MNESALALGITAKLPKYKAINAQNGHGHENHAASYGCGGRHESGDLERLSDRIAHWRYLPMGTLNFNWAISTRPMYVRAAVATRVLRADTCAQPSRPESGCTAHGAVKSIEHNFSDGLRTLARARHSFFLHFFFLFLSESVWRLSVDVIMFVILSMFVFLVLFCFFPLSHLAV